MTLGGSLSTQLGLLTTLTDLELLGAALVGTLVSELGRLTRLRRLMISGNNLSRSSIPTELGDIGSLTRLYLDSNSLQGTLPSELGRLSNLNELSVSNNNALRGTVPFQILTLPLKTFSWSTNTMLSLGSATMNVESAFPPVADYKPGQPWHSTLPLTDMMRFSFFAEDDVVHLMLETTSKSWCAIGFGPRLPGAAMSGADLVSLVFVETQATVLLYDGFAVLDRERPDVDSNLGGNGSDWFDVSGDRVGNVTRYRLSRARFTDDRWDNPIPATSAIETMFAIGSTPGFDDGALGSFHGSRRVTQFVQWAAPPAPELPVGSIVGGVLGGVALLLVVVVLIVVAVRYFHQEARDETGLIDGERVPLGAALTETELQHLPVRLVNASAGVFFDPVLEEAFDEPALCQLRASQEERQAPAGGVRLLQLDKIYVDVLTLRNAATQRAHTFKIHLPPIAPQYIIDVEPTQFRLAAGASKVLQVRIVMLCTTAQNIAIKVSVDDESVGELPPIRVESELSTALDFDEVAVRSASARAPTASCLPARGAGSRSPSSCSGRNCSRRTISPTSRRRRACSVSCCTRTSSASAASRSSRRAAAS
jgi:hypothetical protein